MGEMRKGRKEGENSEGKTQRKRKKGVDGRRGGWKRGKGRRGKERLDKRLEKGKLSC